MTYDKLGYSGTREIFFKIEWIFDTKIDVIFSRLVSEAYSINSQIHKNKTYFANL